MNRVLVLVAILLAALVGAIACGALFPLSPGPTPMSNPATPNPRIDFPLALDNMWVFRATRYQGNPPPDVITAALVITETVVDIQSVRSGGVTDDLELRLRANRGKNLVHSAKDGIVDEVFGTVFTLQNRKTLQDYDARLP